MMSNSETTEVRSDEDVAAIEEAAAEAVLSDDTEAETASTDEETSTDSTETVADESDEALEVTSDTEESEGDVGGEAPVEAADEPEVATELSETTDDGAEAELAETTDDGAEAAETDEDGDTAEVVDDFFNPSNPAMKWYVVHTYSGYENRAQQCLLDRVVAEGVEEMFGKILIPTEEVVEMKKGAKRTTTRKFFPGYMLVQMELTTDTWHLVKSTQKITGFVGGTSRMPRPIPDSEVRRVTDQITDGAEKPKLKETFEEGSQVRVTDGPFLNFTGSVEEVRPEKQKLRVLVSIFGRATPVELDFIQVERL